MNTFAQRRLCKSRTDRMIDGVCGGIAGYFGLDPTLVRIAWVLLTLFGGSGVVLYIAAMIIMPKEELHTAAAAGGAPSAAPPVPANGMNNSRFWGILLLVLGVAWLAGNFGFSVWHHWWGFSWDVAIPLMLILAGVAFLFGGRAYLTSPSTTADSAGAGQDSAGAEGSSTRAGGQAGGLGRAAFAPPQIRTKLQRSRREKKLLGVCGGLGDYMQVDPVIVRLVFVMAALASFGIVAVAYIVLGIVVPKEPESVPAGATAAAAV